MLNILSRNIHISYLSTAAELEKVQEEFVDYQSELLVVSGALSSLMTIKLANCHQFEPPTEVVASAKKSNVRLQLASQEVVIIQSCLLSMPIQCSHVFVESCNNIHLLN